jgi:hypothetical protein
MKRRTSRGMAVALAGLSLSTLSTLAAPYASAGTATGTTTLLGAAVAGSSVDVDVSVVSTTPVVAFEYAMRNECRFPGSKTGRIDSVQVDAIESWIYSSDSSTIPHATVTIQLLTVPAGSACKVFLLKNNTLVKGSVTAYPVTI